MSSTPQPLVFLRLTAEFGRFVLSVHNEQRQTAHREIAAWAELRSTIETKHLVAIAQPDGLEIL